MKETINEIKYFLDYYYEVNREFDLYKYIKENQEIYTKETQEISYFLNVILVSLLNSTLLNISKILDKRNEKNMYRLLEHCIQNMNNTKDKNEKLNIQIKNTLGIQVNYLKNIRLNMRRLKIF